MSSPFRSIKRLLKNRQTNSPNFTRDSRCSSNPPRKPAVILPILKWLWIKNRYPKWLALVNGDMDQTLRSESIPACFILTHNQVPEEGFVGSARSQLPPAPHGDEARDLASDPVPGVGSAPTGSHSSGCILRAARNFWGGFP